MMMIWKDEGWTTTVIQPSSVSSLHLYAALLAMPALI